MVGKLCVLVFVVGCATEPSTPVILAVDDDAIAAIEAQTETAQPEMCGLAAALSPDDPCSQICDPDAFADALAAAGFEPGRCYLLQCQMSDTMTIAAAACLPPP